MAMMTVMFEVSVEESGSVMQALAPCMENLQNFSMESKTAKRRGARRKSRTRDAALAALKDGPKGTSHLARLFKTAGLSESSVSPTMSTLKAEGIVSWDHTAALWSLRRE